VDGSTFGLSMRKAIFGGRGHELEHPRGRMQTMDVYVHGGVAAKARAEPHSLRLAVVSGLDAANALDSVEAAVRALEDDPELNAGFGSVLTRDGNLELDAGIADGAGDRFGGVIGVTVTHPISLARRVMERTPHILMSGQGAMTLGGDMEVLGATSDKQLNRWKQAERNGALAEPFGFSDEVDTVGAVARDKQGRLAAASSTGGVFGKLSGRVGDAPISGAGVYATASAAVVGTGIGEVFLTDLASARVAFLIEKGAHPQEACAEIVKLLGRRKPFLAALLALDAHGRVGAAFRGGELVIEGPEGPIEPAQLP
jgi:beta-aspartyl-peptidase (threonine type)